MRRTATADFYTRRRLLLAGAALPLAAALPSLPGIPHPACVMTVGEAIAWLHHVGFRLPHERDYPSAFRHD